MDKVRRVHKAFNKIFETLNLGRIEEVEYLSSNQSVIYKILTEQKKYYVKQYSKDVLKNEKDLFDKRRQVAVIEKFSENGVPVVIPLKFNGSFFIKYYKDYFLIYDYSFLETLDSKDLTYKNIKKLANTLAVIHKLNIKCNLECQYRVVKIDFNKYMVKYKKISESLYDIFKDNCFLLEKLINTCNVNIEKVKENLCVSHGNYQLSNILWKKDYMYLINFESLYMANPDVSFAESAFILSLQEKNFNKEFYKDFVSSYIKKYGEINLEFENVLNVCMNGKLQLLEYLMNRCLEKDQKSIDDTISLIHELVCFIKNKGVMLDIFNEVTIIKKNSKRGKKMKNNIT